MRSPFTPTNVIGSFLGLAIIAFVGGGRLDGYTLLLMAAVVLAGVLFGRLMRWLEER